jgi:hypothetical protein
VKKLEAGEIIFLRFFFSMEKKIPAGRLLKRKCRDTTREIKTNSQDRKTNAALLFQDAKSL